jgi:TPR repeat protein
LGKLAETDSVYGSGAFQWFSTAANNGHLLASFELGCIYLKGEFGQKAELLKAWELLLQPAKDGHADAQFLLGCMCTFWNGLKPKYPEGVRWFVKAAEQGHVEACFNLGYAYQMGQGIELSLSLAISWYLKSAKAGHINSQINLGVILLSKNREDGIYWLKIAAGHESQKAKNLLKNIYLEEKEETGKLQEPFMLEQEEQQSKEKAAEPLKIEHESGAASVVEDFIQDSPQKKLESISPDESKEPTESRICSLQ